MVKKACLVVFVLIVFCIGIAFATPSFRGYTGLVSVPNADSLDKKEFSFGVNTEKVSIFDANNIFVNYGVDDNFEIGFNSRLPVDGTRDTLISGKYQIRPETEANPAIAVGVYDLTGEVKATNYIVLSKSLVKGIQLLNEEITNLRGHIGFGGGYFDGVFAGISVLVENLQE